jgi:signal transduction histidine kinase/CheY-like chemotaxis protein
MRDHSLPAKTKNTRTTHSDRLVTPRRLAATTLPNYAALVSLVVNLIRGCFCALSLIIANPIIAQTAQTVDRLIKTDTGQINLALSATFLEDPTGALTLDEVVELDAQGAFKPNSRKQLHFGMTRSAYWVHLTLPWRGNESDAYRILEIGPPKLVPGRVRGGIDLYTLGANNATLLSYRLGSLTDSRESKTLSRGHAFQVSPSLGTEYYLRITSAAPLRTGISLWEESAFEAQAMTSDIGLGVMYGILLAMTCFNLFQYITIRERPYLLYVLAIGTQTAFLFLDMRHLRFLLGDFTTSIWFVDVAERLIYPAVVIGFIAFQRSLLSIQENNPLLDRIGRWFIAAFGVVALLSFIPDEKYFQFSFVALLTIGLPFAFYSNLDAIRRGDYSAMVHMVAMSTYLAGAAVLLLVQTVPNFPVNTLTANAYNIGQIAQALLLSFSLSTRYNLLKKEKEDAQKLAIDNLVQAERIKDDLLANVSHELRTPLFGINGLAETALGEFRRNTQNVSLITKNLELIQASGDRLTMLVNDLLDFSSSKAEQPYIKLQAIDLHKMVTLVIAICSPHIGDKQIKLRNEVDPDLPLISADEDRLQQILVNLTTNAIKFTRSGKIDICGVVTADSMIKVSVKDTGIGIHERDHESIFRSFEKLDSKQQNAQGVGLGLPIAKRMIEMHRSELHMTSSLDIGSEFSFKLRMSLDQNRAGVAGIVNKQMIRRADFMQGALRKEIDPELKSEQGTTVLIVDDDEINRIVMGQQLTDYTVINCSNGLDALTAVAESKPDLILLDLMMPGLNGYEVCQKLRQRYSPIELPIILVTAKNHLEDLTKGFETGANDYLPKPFHNEELKSRVENQLKLRMLHRTNEDNIRLRALIKSYSAADTELRSSRMQLQRVLETIDHGFIAFELPGRIFSLNQKAADLLGADKLTLDEREITSLFAESPNSEKLLSALAKWEAGDLLSNTGGSIFSLNEKVTLATPYHSTTQQKTEFLTFDVRLTLFLNDEGTGVLFLLPDSTTAEESFATNKSYDTVDLVGILGQAQQSVRKISARLGVLTPIELSQHPGLLAELAGIDRLVEQLDSNLPDIASDSEYRQQLVTLMRSALHAWEVTTQKTKIELAEESNIWAVSIDDGRLRTRTFDRYSRIEQLPKAPRWREVVRTAYFVLSLPTIEAETRFELEQELEKTKTILKKSAIS